MFYCSFTNKFLEIWSFISYRFWNHFARITQNFSENFPTFSKSSKTIFFVSKLVQNHYIDQNLHKCSLQQQSIFPYRHQFFKIFSAFGAENLEFYVPKSRSFLSWAPAWDGVFKFYIQKYNKPYQDLADIVPAMEIAFNPV